jgi:hypothetical protein
METKTQKLIKGLNIVINALKNGTIHYDWTQQDSCNCGVVAQAILGKTKEEIRTFYNEISSGLAKHNTKDTKIDLTWQNGVKYLCPLTGEPMIEVFKKLFEAGLSKSDIVHLEYMNNPAILKRSGIQLKIKKVVVEKKLAETVTRLETQKHPNLFPRLFGKTVQVAVKTDVYKEIKSEKIIVDDYFHTKQHNLIKYLTAWVSILQEGAKYKEEDLGGLTIEELESELLIAVAEDKFEYACLLRDTINAK